MNVPNTNASNGRDARAVSTAVSHVLTLGISAVLITGLVVGMGGFIEEQRRSAAEGELTVIGERMAGELERVDGLAQQGVDPEITLRTGHAKRVVGGSYLVRLSPPAACPTSDPCLVLSSGVVDAEAVVPVEMSAAVEESAVSGGRLQFVYDPASGEIRIESRGGS
jgi:hypothetical protein